MVQHFVKMSENGPVVAERIYGVDPAKFHIQYRQAKQRG